MSLSNPLDTFTYAAHKSPYHSTISAFLFICLAEEIPIALLVQHFYLTCSYKR
ncbi:MAG TPA: hypothetical protein VGM01_06410 [Ktedonobacteraceae bacterium]